MNTLQHYLRTGGSLSNLAENYNIGTRRHTKHDNLVCFSYGLGCTFTQEFQLECRGIVLDEADYWNCVSWPFTKFFNLGETRAAQIDWTQARVEEKNDGTMIQCYQYAGEWHVGTTGTPDAAMPVNDLQVTFRQIYEVAMKRMGCWPLGAHKPGVTLLFELMTPYNKIVVQHEEPKAVFIAARDTKTGVWLSNDLPEFDRYPKVKTFNIHSAEEALAIVEKMNGMEQEGFVAVGPIGERVKIKCPDYVEKHHAATGTTLRALVEIYKKGETGEMIAYFPHLKRAFDDIDETLVKRASEIDELYTSLSHLTDRKEFAQEALDSIDSSVLFAMRDKNISALQFIKTMRTDAIIERFNLKEVWFGKYRDLLQEK